MTEIFICEKGMPIKCDECKACNLITGNCKVSQVDLYYGKAPDCPLRSLEQHDKEVEKRVAREILTRISRAIVSLILANATGQNYDLESEFDKIAEKYGVEVNK